MYNKTPIFILVDIMEDLVNLVARKILGISGTSGTDLEYLQGWLLKVGKEIKNFLLVLEFFLTG